jgi:hypothetical protein
MATDVDFDHLHNPARSGVGRSFDPSLAFGLALAYVADRVRAATSALLAAVVAVGVVVAAVVIGYVGVRLLVDLCRPWL